MKSLLNSTSSQHSVVTVNPSLTIKTFDQICLLPDKSIVATVIAKVITKSKDINGAYGPYNISKLKDIEGSKIDINLYSNSIRKKINRGDVIELKQLKLTKFERNGENLGPDSNGMGVINKYSLHWHSFGEALESLKSVKMAIRPLPRRKVYA